MTIDNNAAALPALPAATAARGKEAETARKFEAVFIGEMTRTMMETVEPDAQFGGGHGEEMFRGVLAEQLGTAIAGRGGIGLAPVVLDQIIQLQGGTLP